LTWSTSVSNLNRTKRRLGIAIDVIDTGLGDGLAVNKLHVRFLTPSLSDSDPEKVIYTRASVTKYGLPV